jgi:hypothetical protein
MTVSGHNNRTLRKYVAHWSISTEHFDPRAARSTPGRAGPLDEVLVCGSSYHRGHLKARLYAEGLKQPVCELCGQDEQWFGRRMSLILDHVNGIANDHRLENLRIVCPNCAATLPTHCGRNAPRSCQHCGGLFRPRSRRQRYCSRACGGHAGGRVAGARLRRTKRPPAERLLQEVGDRGYRAVARRYGVSDNAIRKWLRAEGIDPPRGTWPNRRRR